MAANRLVLFKSLKAMPLNCGRETASSHLRSSSPSGPRRVSEVLGLAGVRRLRELGRARTLLWKTVTVTLAQLTQLLSRCDKVTF